MTEHPGISFSKPDELADALAKGEVDVVSTWQPYLADMPNYLNHVSLDALKAVSPAAVTIIY